MKFDDKQKEIIYSSMQKMTKTGGWTLDVKTGKSQWSVETYNIHELPIGTPTDKINGINYYAEHERDRVEKYLEECISKGKDFDGEFEFYTAKGNKKWVRSSGKAIENEKGEVETLIGTFQDITDVKLKELELKESETYLKLAIEGTGLGIWDWYLKDNSVKFDSNWAKMLGYDLSEIEMELSTWESKVYPDDLANCYKDIQNYMEGKTEQYHNIHRMKHKEGHWVWILDQGRFSDWDNEGNPVRFTGTHFDITEEKNQTHRLDMFYNKSNIGYAFCNMDGEILDSNKAYQSITGYNNEELKTLSYWDLTPKKFEKEETKQINSLTTSGKYGPYEKEYLRKDGTLVNVRLNGFIFEDPTYGKGIWSIVEDISEARKKEDELKQFFNVSLDLLCIAGLDGYFKKINPAFIEVLGYSEEELLSIPFSELIHPEDISTTNKELEKLSKGEVNLNFINRYKTKKGDYKYLSWRAFPDLDKNILYASTHDITEDFNRKRSLTRTIQEKNIQNKILEISNDSNINLNQKLQWVLEEILILDYLSIKSQGGIFITDDVDLNKIKMVASKSLATPIMNLCKEVDLGHCLCGQAALLRKTIHASCVDERHSVRFEGMGPHGHYNVPILSSNKDLLGVMVFYLEHGHERNEEEINILENIAKHIGELIEKEYSRRYIEQQRAHAQHQSKLASIGEMSAGVAHEINNPLAFIKAYLTKLEKENPESKETFDKVNIGINRIVNIVKGLRSFSRLDDITDEEFLAKDSISESINLLEEIYKKSGIDFTYNFLDNNFEVLLLGNRGKFQQVLMNLISNAKDAVSNTRDKKVEVTAKVVDDFFEVVVKDSGCGMSDEIKEKIFNPFFTTKSIGQGTGIGMSIAHGLVSDMKGEIKIESEEGKGTKFILKFPYRKKQKEQNVPTEYSCQNCNHDNKNNEKVLSCLIVDDEESILDVLDFIMEDLSVKVVRARNGKEALLKLKDENIDFIISDINMPEMSGEELIDELKIKQKSKLPFIFITGGINNKIYEEKYKDYVYDVFEKPFDELRIKETVNNIRNDR